MITCDFYLRPQGYSSVRVKTILGENIKACWNTFKKDFGEAMSELCKVKVIDENASEHHYSPEQFKARLKGEIQTDSFSQIDHLEKRALLNDDMDNS